MKENAKIIAIDLDGTTLRNDGKTISDYTAEVLKKVIEKGHIIIIATGRSYRCTIDYYRQLELDSPMINFNGALVSKPDDKKWKSTRKRYIPKAFVFDLLKHQQNFQLGLVAVEYRRKFYLNNFSAIDPLILGVDAFHAYNRLRADRLTTDPHAVLLSTNAKDKIGLARAIQKHYSNAVSVSAWGGPNDILEVVPHGVNKGDGLKHAVKAMGSDYTNVIAFGDEFNDVEMFQYATTGYAMKNASNELLAHATEVLPWTNEEDGVAKKLEELFL